MSARTKPLAGFEAIEVGAIHPNPNNPRKRLDDLEDLADSIKAQGILEPLIVMPHPTWPDERFQILAGHRRLAAAELAGLAQVPCIIRKGKTVAGGLEFALVENGQRADLDPIDEARAIKQLMQLLDISATEVARRIGRSGALVHKRLALLELTPTAQQQVKTGQLGVAAAHERVMKKRGSAGTRPEQHHFGAGHPLASEAREECRTAHNRRGVRLVGGQACGQCWELVIRRDEVASHG